MKKKSSTSAAFFNLRVLLGFTLSFLGLALAILAGKDIALRNLQGPTRADVLAGRSGETARYMPVPGRNAREEASGLARLEQYWNDRLTFPTGRFNPAWVPNQRFPSSSSVMAQTELLVRPCAVV